MRARHSPPNYTENLEAIHHAHKHNAKIMALQSLINALKEESNKKWPWYRFDSTKKTLLSELDKLTEEKLETTIKYPMQDAAHSESNGANIQHLKNLTTGITMHLYLSSFFGRNPRIQQLEKSIDLIIDIDGAKTGNNTTAANTPENSPRTPGAKANSNHIYSQIQICPEAQNEARQNTHQEQTPNTPTQDLEAIFKTNLHSQLTDIIDNWQAERGNKKPSKKLEKIIKTIKTLKPSNNEQAPDNFIKEILVLKEELRTTSKSWFGGSKTLSNLLKYGFAHTKEKLEENYRALETKNLDDLNNLSSLNNLNKPRTLKKPDNALDNSNASSRAANHESENLPFMTATHQRKTTPHRKSKGYTVYPKPPINTVATNVKKELPALLPETKVIENFCTYINAHFPGTGLHALILSSNRIALYEHEEASDKKNSAKEAVKAMTKAIDSETTLEISNLISIITALFLYQLNTDAPVTAPIDTLFEHLSNIDDRQGNPIDSEQIKPCMYVKNALGVATNELTIFGALTNKLVEITKETPVPHTDRFIIFMATMQKLQTQLLCKQNESKNPAGNIQQTAQSPFTMFSAWGSNIVEQGKAGYKAGYKAIRESTNANKDASQRSSPGT